LRRRNVSTIALLISPVAALAARIPVAESDLEALGHLRAQAIQDALLGSGAIDPSRVFVINLPPKPASGGVN
jgi:hypothetical protein